MLKNRIETGRIFNRIFHDDYSENHDLIIFIMDKFQWVGIIKIVGLTSITESNQIREALDIL